MRLRRSLVPLGGALLLLLVPEIHTETVRDDGTLGGVHSLDSIEGGGKIGSTARVGWSLRPAE